MKRDGNVIMLVLIVSTVCMVTVAFAMESVFIQNMLVLNRRDNIQAELSLEGMVAKLLIDSEEKQNLVMEIVSDLSFRESDSVSFPLSIDGMQNTTGTIDFTKCDEGRMKYKLNVEGTRNGVQDSIVAAGHVYDPVIDHCDNGLVTIQGKSLEESEEVNLFLNEMKHKFNGEEVTSDYFLAHNYLENEVEIRAKSSGYRYIDFIRGDHISKYSFWNGKLVLFKEYDGFNRDIVRLKESSSSLTEGTVKGIMYIEDGDLIISGDIHFNGIIIIENGNLIKEGEGEVIIYGKVIMNNFNQPDEGIQIVYDHELFRQMTRFIPCFISPGIDSIR
ncbi:hypothetical protein [Gudongella sp. DL1XJH-153]|uniref:hypothetical protein n=1 Tax=Gudongella sp. DL1XJH-153 TaxID=3409804 RepID=UPI003BB4A84E